MGMGLGVNWNVTAMSAAMPSLVDHLIFGSILGVTYRWLEDRTGSPTCATAKPRPRDRLTDDRRGEGRTSLLRLPK